MSQKQPAPPPVLAPDSTLAFTPAPASAPGLPPPGDHAWLPRGRTRCGLARFALWLAVWVALLIWGVYAAALALGEGLYVTRLNDLTPYGLWITFDLAVMALAGGAFVTGPLLYFCRKKEVGQIDGLAVLLGFVCYTGAVGVLFLEIGQPLRAWFGFWHANVASMLTEVIFCVTLYCLVLGIEFAPHALMQRQLARLVFLRILARNLRWIMPLFAMLGVFLSIFHQGSLGGMYGVLWARPFTFREGLGIWPWTFFLFVLSAAGAGPLFTLLCGEIMEKCTRRRLLPGRVKILLAKTGGLILAIYVVGKAVDTLAWTTGILPRFGYAFDEAFHGALYGQWLLVMELAVCGALPCMLLLVPRLRRRAWLTRLAAFLACLGVFINRYVQTVQNLALPSLPFEDWTSYLPNWVEMAPCAAAVAYGIIVLSLAYRYLPLFPVEEDFRAMEERSGEAGKDWREPEN